MLHVQERASEYDTRMTTKRYKRGRHTDRKPPRKRVAKLVTKQNEEVSVTRGDKHIGSITAVLRHYSHLRFQNNDTFAVKSNGTPFLMQFSLRFSE